MEKIDADYELETFRLKFSRCGKRDVAPFKKLRPNVALKVVS